jgi:ketosteroid isomerase-like protein
MRVVFSALLLGTAILTSCAAVPTPAAQAVAASPQAVVDELLATDRAFAAASAQTDSVSGLSAMLDKDIVMFVIPLPALAHGKAEATETLRAGFGTPASKTDWQPIRGGVSADGQQGFTYGYMTTQIDGQQTKLAKYLSYWIRRPEGWRVAAFKWVPRPEGTVELAMRAPSRPAKIVPVSADATALARYRASLDRTERAFSDESQVTGLGRAFKKYGSADAMNVAGEAEFTFGNEAIGIIQGGDAPGSPLNWAPEDVLVASSGDLGLTWGLLLRNGPTPPGRLAKIPFFTVWHRDSPDGPWLYIAE